MDAVRNIDIGSIEVADRLRVVDDAIAVEELVASISDIGLINPIAVAGPAGGPYRLIAGAHRLEAVKRLDWSEVPATVFDIDATTARLAEVDENLMRRELDALDRAAALAERKRLYEALHPETAHGGDRRSDQVAKLATWSASFSEVAAKRYRFSDRQVRREVARHLKIAADVRAMIARTWIAEKGTELDALAKLSPEDQRAAIALMLRAEKPAGSVKVALSIIADAPAPDPDAAALAALMKLWRRTPRQAKREFLDYLVSCGVSLETPTAEL